jgi:hypothetical protein
MHFACYGTMTTPYMYFTYEATQCLRGLIILCVTSNLLNLLKLWYHLIMSNRLCHSLALMVGNGHRYVVHKTSLKGQELFWVSWNNYHQLTLHSLIHNLQMSKILPPSIRTGEAFNNKSNFQKVSATFLST